MLFVMGQYLSLENQQIYLKSKFLFLIILFKFYAIHLCFYKAYSSTSSETYPALRLPMTVSSLLLFEMVQMSTGSP